MSHSADIPELVRFVVEVPRGGRLKRGADGRLEYVSPFACPFNYGSAPAHPAADGDPADVVILGPTLSLSATGRARVVAVARFTDAGVTDDKWVVVPEGDGGESRSATDAELAVVEAFFRRYQRIKGLLHRLRPGAGRTVFHGVERLSAFRPTR